MTSRKIIYQNAFKLHASLIASDPERWTPLIMRVGDRIYIQIDGAFGIPRGVTELPKDGSYLRFIANSWYDDVDVQNL